jgi:hypothetical protein
LWLSPRRAIRRTVSCDVPDDVTYCQLVQLSTHFSDSGSYRQELVHLLAECDRLSAAPGGHRAELRGIYVDPSMNRTEFSFGKAGWLSLRCGRCDRVPRFNVVGVGWYDDGPRLQVHRRMPSPWGPGQHPQRGTRIAMGNDGVADPRFRISWRDDTQHDAEGRPKWAPRSRYTCASHCGLERKILNIRAVRAYLSAIGEGKRELVIGDGGDL